MEEIKSYVKSKIASFSERVVETVMLMVMIIIKLFQSWSKKRRRDDDDAVSSSSKSNEQDKIALLLSSEVESKRRRTEVIETVLNEDVLEEVMLRLPAKALTRFQTVSSHWRGMIKSKTFKNRYMFYHKTQEPKFLCLYDDDESKNLTLKIMRLKCSSTCLIEGSPGHQIEQRSKEDVRVSGSCDGLVCIFDAKSFTTPIIVTNPALGRSQTLPLSLLQQQYKNKEKPAPKGFCFPGFGRDNITGTYKLVWLHRIKRNNKPPSVSCEVFDFEVKEWRYAIRDLPSMISPHQLPTFANGWVYWFTVERKILACNLHTKMFKSITIDDIVFQTPSLDTMDMFSVNDSLWITNMKEEKGMQHFWRIRNILKPEVVWQTEKMFSINSSFLSRWLPAKHGSSSSSPLVSQIATPKDNKKVLVSELCSSKIVHLLPRFHSSVFQSVFSVPYDTDFVPYFQSLDFPL